MIRTSVFRLNLLRAGYLLLVVGLGSAIWPELLDPADSWGLARGEVMCMLGALSALSMLGLRYPLQMLPLLFFELAWKSIWLLRVAWPAWTAHRLDAAAAETAFECSIAAVFLVVIPWSRVWSDYVMKPADPWRRRAASPP